MNEVHSKSRLFRLKVQRGGTQSDFSVANHGSIAILTANSEAARAWVEEHLPEDRQTWGQNGTAVEPRFIGDICAGIADAGLSIE